MPPGRQLNDSAEVNFYRHRALRCNASGTYPRHRNRGVVLRLAKHRGRWGKWSAPCGPHLLHAAVQLEFEGWIEIKRRGPGIFQFRLASTDSPSHPACM